MAKNELISAVQKHQLTPIIDALNAVRKYQKQIMLWNPDDQEFAHVLEEAANLEKLMIMELAEKHGLAATDARASKVKFKSVKKKKLFSR